MPKNTIKPSVEQKGSLRFVQRRLLHHRSEAQKWEGEFRDLVGEILASQGVQNHTGNIQLTDDLNLVLEGSSANGASSQSAPKKSRGRRAKKAAQGGEEK